MQPNGKLSRCPACGTSLTAADEPFGQAHCPRCEATLWYLSSEGSAIFFIRRPSESFYGFLSQYVDDDLGIPPEEFEQVMVEADSLDAAEIVMDIEEKIRGTFEVIGLRVGENYPVISIGLHEVTAKPLCAAPSPTCPSKSRCG